MASTFKDRLTSAMERRGMSRSELARRLDVTPAAVSSWTTGPKRPDLKKLEHIADELAVSPAYLLFGEGAARSAPEEAIAERQAYLKALAWRWRSAPRDRGREYGNAAGYAFQIDLETLARESGQNILDERLPTEPTVEALYTVIELTGSHLEEFLERIHFEELRPHLDAALKSNQKATSVISAGLEELDAKGRMRLIRIEDRHANGLTGPEYEKDRYMAVIRNILDSYKSETAGGSYGLGLSTLWASSAFGLVLTNSTLSVPQDGKTAGRFHGRIELPWHKTGQGQFAGPGWFGEPDPDEECQVTRSYWGNRALGTDLYMPREDGIPGTTFLVVGAYDASDQVEEIEQFAELLAKGLADNFWPAMVDTDDAPARLRALVRVERNGTRVSERLVDPVAYQPAVVDAYRKHLADDVRNDLEEVGDVARRQVSLRIPRRIADPKHSQTEDQAILLVRQADDGDESAGTVSCLRGSLMVIQSPAVSALPVGARPFHAIVLAGEASGAQETDRHAERFLRAAEPPAHNKWTATPELTTSYVRGGAAQIRRFLQDVNKEIRDVVRQATRNLSDGPESLKELLQIVPPKPAREKRPRVKSVKGQPGSDGSWQLDEIVVSLPIRDDGKGWTFVPVLQFGTESGPGISVRWRRVEPVTRCELVDGQLRTRSDARTAVFSGETDPGSHPVGADRAKVLVDVRQHSGGGHR
jgi:transcriptional regulator with XRE-family HTH domain